LPWATIFRAFGPAAVNRRAEGSAAVSRRAEGSAYVSPGQRPGERLTETKKALKGRPNPYAAMPTVVENITFEPPFQGFCFDTDPLPRALPWATIFRAFGPAAVNRRAEGSAAVNRRAEGPAYVSPGQRPGERLTETKKALKGRPNPYAAMPTVVENITFEPPFQGFCFDTDPLPRALPWATIFRAFGPAAVNRRAEGSAAVNRRAEGSAYVSPGQRPGERLTETKKALKGRPNLHAYMAEVLHNIQCPAVLINSVEDHVHILFELARTVSVSAAVEEVKKSSSKWVKTQGAGFLGFSWQAGYGAFAVSESNVAAVRDYIAGQREHHRQKTFQEEYRAFLERHRVAFDEKYVWD
jgi:putative transposase